MCLRNRYVEFLGPAIPPSFQTRTLNSIPFSNQIDAPVCIVLYSSIYTAPLNSHGQTEAGAFGSISSKKRDKLSEVIRT